MSRPPNTITVQAYDFSEPTKSITINFSFAHKRQPRRGDRIITTLRTSVTNFQHGVSIDRDIGRFGAEALLEHIISTGSRGPFLGTSLLEGSLAGRSAIRVFATAWPAIFRLNARTGQMPEEETFSINAPKYSERLFVPLQPSRDPYSGFETTGARWVANETRPGGGDFELGPKNEPALIQQIGQAVTYRWISDPPWHNANSFRYFGIKPDEMHRVTQVALNFASFYLNNGPTNVRVQKTMDPLGPPRSLYRNDGYVRPYEVVWFPQSGTDQLGFRITESARTLAYRATMTGLIRASELERRLQTLGYLEAVDVLGLGQAFLIEPEELQKVINAWHAVQSQNVGPIPRFPFKVTLITRDGGEDVRLVNVEKTAERVKRNRKTLFELHRLPESRTSGVFKVSAAELETAPLEFTQGTLPVSEAQRILAAYDHWLSLGQVRGI